MIVPRKEDKVPDGSDTNSVCVTRMKARGTWGYDEVRVGSMVESWKNREGEEEREVLSS